MQRPPAYAWFGNPKHFWKTFAVESNRPIAKRLSTSRLDYLDGQARKTNKPTKQENRKARNTAITSHETSSAMAVLKVGRTAKVDPDPPKPAYARSFLFEEPRRPAAKRQLRDKDRLKNTPPKDLTRFEKDLASNPFAAILASPIRQCFYTRKSLPNAFMTKLIQAAERESSDRPWIVSEGIIPAGASATTKEPRRFGIGKWIFSDSKIVNAMVKEGKYKMINTAAFIRPDLPQLIYAQMTYRIASDFQSLGRHTKNSIVQLDLPDNESFNRGTTLRGRLQCVLYFPRNEQSKVSEPPSPGDDKAVAPNHQLPQLPPVLIARATAVDEIKLIITTKDVDKDIITVPRYNMAKLFTNYPQGLATIRQECKRANIELDDSQDYWIGLYESKSTIPLAIDLWKLCQILPSSKSPTK